MENFEQEQKEFISGIINSITSEEESLKQIKKETNICTAILVGLLLFVVILIVLASVCHVKESVIDLIIITIGFCIIVGLLILSMIKSLNKEKQIRNQKVSTTKLLLGMIMKN